MTEHSDELSESGHEKIPEIVDETTELVLTHEEKVKIGAAITFINRTVSAKALEAAFLVGDHILTHFFDNDIATAFSQDPDKPVSFNALCQHPDLRISRNQLISMVKISAQQRFLDEVGVDVAALHYSHLEKLTQLPNDEIKIDLVQKCAAEQMTTRQLSYHVRMRKIEMQASEYGEGAPNESNPSQTIAMDVAEELTRLTGQVKALNLESACSIINYIHPEARGLLQNRLMVFMDALNAAETQCAHLLSRLQPDDSAH